MLSIGVELPSCGRAIVERHQQATEAETELNRGHLLGHGVGQAPALGVHHLARMEPVRSWVHVLERANEGLEIGNRLSARQHGACLASRLTRIGEWIADDKAAGAEGRRDGEARQDGEESWAHATETFPRRYSHAGRGFYSENFAGPLQPRPALPVSPQHPVGNAKISRRADA